MKRYVRALSLATLLLFSACELVGPDRFPDEEVDDRAFLYVTSQDDALVTIIDMNRNRVVETVDLAEKGFSATAKPHHIAVEPDGSFWYVSLIGDNKVIKFNRENEVVGSVDMETPGMLAVHPTSDILYAGRSMTALTPPKSIGKIQRSTMALEEVSVVFPRPHALAIHPTGAYVYSASLAENQLFSVEVATDDVAFTAVEGSPQAFVQYALSPDGQTMYVSSQLTNQMHVFSLADAANPTLISSIGVNGQPWHPVYTPDGGFVYVGNKAANTVTVLDAERHIVVDIISGEGLAQPHGSAISPNGEYVYISNNNTKGTYVPEDGGTGGTLVVIETRTNRIVKVIELGRNPTGVGR